MNAPVMQEPPPPLDFSPGENDRAVLERVLRAFWSAVPQAAGVLLLDDNGRPLAYDLVHTEDPDGMAREAVRLRDELKRRTVGYGPGTPVGTLVADAEGGHVLVVFLPADYADEFPHVEIPEGVAA
jgi:hypothetical protein